MIKIKMGGTELGLRFDGYAYELMYEQFGGWEKAVQLLAGKDENGEKITDKIRLQHQVLNACIDVVVCMGNAALYSLGEPEELNHKRVASMLMPGNIGPVAKAVMAALNEGMHTEIETGASNGGAVDVTLQELDAAEKKAEP